VEKRKKTSRDGDPPPKNHQPSGRPSGKTEGLLCYLKRESDLHRLRGGTSLRAIMAGEAHRSSEGLKQEFLKRGWGRKKPAHFCLVKRGKKGIFAKEALQYRSEKAGSKGEAVEVFWERIFTFAFPYGKKEERIFSLNAEEKGNNVKWVSFAAQRSGETAGTKEHQSDTPSISARGAGKRRFPQRLGYREDALWQKGSPSCPSSGNDPALRPGKSMNERDIPGKEGGRGSRPYFLLKRGERSQIFTALCDSSAVIDGTKKEGKKVYARGEPAPIGRRKKKKTALNVR